MVLTTDALTTDEPKSPKAHHTSREIDNSAFRNCFQLTDPDNPGIRVKATAQETPTCWSSLL